MTDTEIEGIDLHGEVLCDVPGICQIDAPHPAKFLIRLHCEHEDWSEKWCRHAWKMFKSGSYVIMCRHEECDHRSGALHFWKVARL